MWLSQSSQLQLPSFKVLLLFCLTVRPLSLSTLFKTSQANVCVWVWFFSLFLLIEFLSFHPPRLQLKMFPPIVKLCLICGSFETTSFKLAMLVQPNSIIRRQVCKQPASELPSAFNHNPVVLICLIFCLLPVCP